jgi:membrane protease YdiL (CAAX protease family)
VLREFWSVVVSTAGLFAISSVVWLARPAAEAHQMMSSPRLVGLVALEAALAAVWLPRLRRRGWTQRAITYSAVPLDVARGLALFSVAMVAYVTLWTTTWLAWPQAINATVASMHIGGHPAWWAIALVAAANPLAEEFLYLGYVARALESSSTNVALLASIALRLATHVYQGPFALFSVAPLGLIFGWYYLSTHRIWPVVIAHSVMDAIALARLAGAA